MNGLKDSLDYYCYVALYTIDEDSNISDKDTQSVSLHGSVGFESSLPHRVALRESLGSLSLGSVFKDAASSHEVLTLRNADRSLPSELTVSSPPRGVVQSACIVPITTSEDQQLLDRPVRYLVIGLNPRRPHDEEDSFLLTTLRS